MPAVEVRKKVVTVEEIFHEGGPQADKPLLRGTIMAVVKNPYAGAYVENITPFMEDLEPLGVQLAEELVAALGGDINDIQTYGKGAISGTAGELEHAALWHVPGGHAMRALLSEAQAIVPSCKKVGAAGTRLDIPLSNINASFVRSHFDAIEVGINDAPRADELVLVLVMGTGGRIHARVGGLAVEDIIGEDGLR